MTGFKKFLLAKPAITAIALVSLVSVPMVVLADASAPWTHKAKAKPRAKPHHRKRAVARQAEPMPQAQEQVYQPPVQQPEVAAAPMETPAPPAPVAGPPAPAPAAAAEVHHGGGTLLALVGAAAVIGGIIAASTGGSKSP
ncbi:MAG: hypothetical protein RL367_1783 [Pseudomonadota bacterium]|jgi:hypothetical protein